jgi:hypothetical protein
LIEWSGAKFVQSQQVPMRRSNPSHHENIPPKFKLQVNRVARHQVICNENGISSRHLSSLDSRTSPLNILQLTTFPSKTPDLDTRTCPKNYHRSFHRAFHRHTRKPFGFSCLHSPKNLAPSFFLHSLPLLVCCENATIVSSTARATLRAPRLQQT